MHIHKSRFLVRGEVWYEHEPEPAAVDWILYRQRALPVPGARWRYFHTLVVDLSQDPEALWGQMTPGTAYKVRRARDKDRVLCESAMPVRREALDGFEEIYSQFAAHKGLAPLDRPFLDQLAADGCLELSWVRDRAGQRLASHAYYRDSDRSFLVHTVSLHRTLSDSGARNALGRANRYLFWWDMLRHREQGLKWFDFGGWYPGKTDQDRLEINRFKEGFGGKVVREYNCEQILTLKGWIVLGTAALLNRIQRAGSSARRVPASPEPERAVNPAVPGASTLSEVAESATQRLTEPVP